MMDLLTLIERNVAFAPDKPAIRFEGTILSYDVFNRRIELAVRALKSQLGVEKGDRVAILSLNRPDYLVLLCLRAAWGNTRAVELAAGCHRAALHPV